MGREYGSKQLSENVGINIAVHFTKIFRVTKSYIKFVISVSLVYIKIRLFRKIIRTHKQGAIYNNYKSKCYICNKFHVVIANKFWIPAILAYFLATNIVSHKIY